jgi:hypothetical protein
MSTEFSLRSQQDITRIMGFLHGSDLTKPKLVVIKDADRSVEQNKLLHGRLTDIANQVTHAGMKWDVTVWKRLCTAAWLRETGETIQMIPAIDGKGIDILYERTSKLTVKKCGELIEWIEAFGSEHQVRWTQKDHWGGRY